jgi:hypothetical protein
MQAFARARSNKPSYAAQHAGVTPGAFAMLTISDTASGMPPDVLASRQARTEAGQAHVVQRHTPS